MFEEVSLQKHLQSSSLDIYLKTFAQTFVLLFRELIRCLFSEVLNLICVFLKKGSIPVKNTSVERSLLSKIAFLRKSMVKFCILFYCCIVFSKTQFVSYIDLSDDILNLYLAHVLTLFPCKCCSDIIFYLRTQLL